jgi:hypothetical protein
MRLLPALSPLLVVGVVAAPAAAASPSLKAPAPAAGSVAVAVAPVKAGRPRLSVASAPKGTVVTGGVAGKLAVVAVVRPAGAAKVAPRVVVGGRGARLGAARATGDALGGGALGVRCSSGLAKALGHPLRRGAGAPGGAQLGALGRVLAARICTGTAPDAGGVALLKALGLTAPAGGVLGAPAPAAPVGVASPPPVAAAPAAPAAPSRPAPPTTTPSADNAKPLPATCGTGVTTAGSRVGFRVDIDGRAAGCPSGFTKGTVTFRGATVTFCDNTGWDDGEGDGACKTTDGIWTIYGWHGDAFHGNGMANTSLCGVIATVLATDGAGVTWKREAPVQDAVGACTGPVPPAGTAQCADGIDNDDDGQVDLGGVADSGPDPGCTSSADRDEAEAVYPSTGCWNYVAADPDDATMAYIYVMARGESWSCPQMDGAVVSFNYRHVTACLSQPYWNNATGGTCTVKNGDVWLSGGSGQRIAVAVRVDGPIGCGTYAPGQIDMRAAGVWHEAITQEVAFDGVNLQECPVAW